MSSRRIALVAAAALLSGASVTYAGPNNAWNEFNKRVATQCPSLAMSSKPAGDVNGLQEGFYSTLNAAESRAVDQAIPRVDGGPKPCAERNGISCPTAWNMIALKKAGLLPRFVKYACANAANKP